jgi:hypothetical protein
MTILPVDRTLSIYGALADRSETKGARQRLSEHLMKKYIDGERDEHRLTVEGVVIPLQSRSGNRLTRLGAQQIIYAFRACRCFRKDSRRVISALAARTTSAIVGFCFGSSVLFTPTCGSLGRTWVGNIEGRSIGCVIIGPIADLFLGILENAFLTILFKHATRPCRD